MGGVDCRLNVVDGTEPAGHVLALLDLAVEPLAQCVGDRRGKWSGRSREADRPF
jgi:hypothetical protein